MVSPWLPEEGRSCQTHVDREGRGQAATVTARSCQRQEDLTPQLQTADFQSSEGTSLCFPKAPNCSVGQQPWGTQSVLRALWTCSVGRQPEHQEPSFLSNLDSLGASPDVGVHCGHPQPSQENMS